MGEIVLTSGHAIQSVSSPTESSDRSTLQLTPYSDISRLPTSNSDSSPQQATPPREHRHPDDPIPSIEGEPRSSTVSSSYVDTPVTRTPVVSVSPPPREVQGRLDASSQRDRSEQKSHGIDDIARELGNVNLGNTPVPAPLTMSSMVAALSDVASGRDDQVAQLEPNRKTQSLEPDRRTNRRRSSSKTNATVHNVQDEEPPENRFHDTAIQQAFSDAKNLMGSLTSVLGSGSLHTEPDSAMRRLHERAKNLSRFQCPPTRTVGFVGDSGVGKHWILSN
jgi:hypothetical protein